MSPDNLEEELQEAMGEAEAAIENTAKIIEDRSPNRFEDAATPSERIATEKSAREMSADTMLDERKRWQLEISEARAAADLANNKFKHLTAEFENYKRNTTRETEQAIQDAIANILRDILPLGDNLSRAKRVASEDEKMLEGITMLERAFFIALKKNDINLIPALGCRFDSKVHEAIDRRIADVEPGIIVEEFEKGYTWRSRLLRPARVIVSMKGDGK